MESLSGHPLKGFLKEGRPNQWKCPGHLSQPSPQANWSSEGGAFWASALPPPPPPPRTPPPSPPPPPLLLLQLLLTALNPRLDRAELCASPKGVGRGRGGSFTEPQPEPGEARPRGLPSPGPRTVGVGGCSAASGGGGCRGGGDELGRPPEPPTGPGLTPAARLPSPLRVGSRGLVRAGSCLSAVACGRRAAGRGRGREGPLPGLAGVGAPKFGGEGAEIVFNPVWCIFDRRREGKYPHYREKERDKH
ncbi:hypothetical protein HJG60_010213 [Phyllostomus discolor]|uniref:Uncharacterized protein n=1 Tax=Phyllostomus discolor TaxID=89673 RepID=A0A834EMQ0_9CHIR|nr:hypothetical protein HJG60_010213 [Phyllostomus discolor]